MEDGKNAQPTAEVQLPKATPQPSTTPEPRRIAGLRAGRIVEYVMKNNAMRPMLVVDAGDGTGAIQGALFFDPIMDSNNHPFPLAADPSGHLPRVVTLAPAAFDDAEKPAPGTWHWPAREPVVASGVNAEVIKAALVVELAPVIETMVAKNQSILDTCNEKIAAMVDAVNNACESNIKACQEMLNAAHNARFDETVKEIRGQETPVPDSGAVEKAAGS